MRFSLSTILACPADRVWAEVLRPRLLDYVAHPVVRFTAVDPPQFPEAWRPGEYVVAMRLFGVLPLGTQTIGIRLPPPVRPPEHVLHDAGRSRLIAVWDHRITVAPAGAEATRYTDALRIEAGLPTPLIWAWAQLFFRHRQRRWRRLVANGFDYAR